MNDPLLLRRQVILVIDDDEATCEALASILGDEEYLVITARTGLEGLEIMRTAPVDVAIVDLMMPEMDGWGFVAAVREDPALAGTPVLVMTAHGDRVLATAPVASGYFKKPIVLDRLLQVLHRTLTLRPRERRRRHAHVGDPPDAGVAPGPACAEPGVWQRRGVPHQ